MRIASSVPPYLAIEQQREILPGRGAAASTPGCGRGRTAPAPARRAASRRETAGGTAARRPSASSPAPPSSSPASASTSDAAAGGVKLRARRVHAPDPGDQAPVEHAHALGRVDHHVRHEDDVGPLDVRDRILRDDADAGDELAAARPRAATRRGSNSGSSGRLPALRPRRARPPTACRTRRRRSTDRIPETPRC